jgi:hypothetical protein
VDKQGCPRFLSDDPFDCIAPAFRDLALWRSQYSMTVPVNLGATTRSRGKLLKSTWSNVNEQDLVSFGAGRPC